MKHLKLYSLSLALLSLAACGGSNEHSDNSTNDSTKLSTNLVNNPRSATGTDPQDIASMATMDFKDTVHDFGTIKEGDIVMYEFEFTNNGKSPLIIAGATGSCGCTVPTYPHGGIAPGKTETMKVRFDSNHKSGHQEKTVDIQTNTARGKLMLTIKAEVLENKNKEPLKNLKSN